MSVDTEFDFGINVGYKVIGSEMPIIHSQDILIESKNTRILIGASVYQDKTRIGTQAMHQRGGMIYFDLNNLGNMNYSFLTFGPGLVTFLEYNLNTGSLYIHTGPELPAEYTPEWSVLYPDKYTRQVLITELEAAMVLKRAKKCQEQFELDPEGYANAWN